MSTLITPHDPVGPSPDDDDATGVRALLSALPEPGPMPAYLAERISASLAAEQSQRAVTSGTSVTPLLASTRRRPRRLLFAIAGAAAVVMIGVVGNNMLTTNQLTASSDSAAGAITSGSREAGGPATQSAKDRAVAGEAQSPASIQIRLSATRYTDADFVTLARVLRDAAFDSTQPLAASPSGVGAIGTAGGIADCLSAIGAGGAQMARADLAFYEGAPAVIIVATTDGIPTAYAVGRECSRTDAALLHPATTLP